MERMRTTKTLSCNDQHRNNYPMLNTNRPLRSFPECARIMGLKESQVKQLEYSAFDKIRAALVAYGYKDPQ